ncbi:MAG TPA: phospholipid carrier-dependent glycosyltransferase, partial [Chloroflexota bacterium]
MGEAAAEAGGALAASASRAHGGVSGQLGAGAFIAGCALLALELGCSGLAAWLLTVRRFGALNGAVKGVALGVLWTLGLIAIQVVPLALGVLTRGTVAIASVALLAGAALIPSTRAKQNLPPIASKICRGAGDRASYALACAGALAFAGFGVAWLSFNITVHTESVDALSFHFPGVIRYIQTGSLWHIAQYLPQQAQGNYPQSGDMLMLALVLPWHSFAFVRLFDPILLGLAAVAIYALAVELGAPKPTSVLAALAVCAIRPTLGAAYIDVLTDPAFLLGFSAGALFLTRHRRTSARADLVLAGLGFGLALGTKWYGLTDIPIVVAVWIAAELLRGRDWRSTARDTLIIAAVALAAGGVWMLRNWILTGNPVFDYKVAP